MTLTVQSLAEVMEHRMGDEGYHRLLPSMNNAMIAADCTTVERAAGWMSQIGVESGGLRWFTELGNNCQRYEWRKDLGNDQAGDGCRFKGRGPIQVTGRAHYANLSRWAWKRSLCQSPTFFVDDPDALASVEYGFIGAVWYWLTHKRPDDQDGIAKLCNQYCDERDLIGLTKCVNGGLHGLADRQRIYDRALSMGEAILPSGTAAPAPRPNMSPRPDWRGDPTFLSDLLRSFGVRVTEFPGWLNRGHGDFGAIWGVMWHHTGNINETNEGIAFHPALGLAANMLIHEDGEVVLTGVGIAWHAGKGIYPGLPEDAANQFTIGIECSYGPDRGGEFTIPWPQAQVQAMISVGGALQWFLGYPTDHNIAHKEWAGRDNPLGINKQGKPDPANFDMNWFRDQVGRRAAAGPTGEGEDELSAEAEAMIRKMYAAQNDSLSMYATGPKLTSQAEAYGWDQRVESSALRGEDWGLSLVRQAGDGTLYGVLRNGQPDEFLVQHARAVFNEAVRLGVVKRPEV